MANEIKPAIIAGGVLCGAVIGLGVMSTVGVGTGYLKKDAYKQIIISSALITGCTIASVSFGFSTDQNGKVEKSDIKQYATAGVIGLGIGATATGVGMMLIAKKTD